MLGTRLPDDPDFDLQQPGTYFRVRGTWYGVTPTGLHGNLANHSVIEHPDGTITVGPSILVNAGRGNEWHGYLEAGVWRTC